MLKFERALWTSGGRELIKHNIQELKVFLIVHECM